MLHKQMSLVDLVVKEAADDVASFKGIASTNDVDLQDDIIEPGAFGKTIDPKMVSMLRDHDPKIVIGGWKSFEQDGPRLKVEGEIGTGPNVPRGAETYEAMKRGWLSGISVGFKIKKGGVIYDETKGVRIIKKASLHECSIVAVPANPNARVRHVKSFARTDLADWLAEAGFTSEEIAVVMTKGFDALLYSGTSLRDDEGHPRLTITEIDGHRQQDPADMLDAAVKGFLQDLKGHAHV